MEDKIDRYTVAGGVVVHDRRVLILAWPSRGEVRLPKGHVEPGETVREAALREASEETGYTDLQIESDLGSQRITFEDGSCRVSRIERYFLMTRNGGGERVPGSGEPQFDPMWLPWDAALHALTFAAEREWVRRARRLAAQDKMDGGEG